MNLRPNNLNPEFNTFSYDPESLRNLLVRLQQNPNIQHFQQQNPNVQPQPNFQPDFVSPNQPDNEVVPETQDTQKHNKKGKKNKQSTGTGPSSGPMTLKQWTPDKEPLSENATWTNLRTKSKEPKTPNRTRIRRGGSTAHTNYAVNLEDDKEDAEFDTPRNRLDRHGEIQLNGLPLQVVKSSPVRSR
ncbi:hypothetical protein R6Q57_015388 [Mikania cordata]